jgi:hypothetical protein
MFFQGSLEDALKEACKPSARDVSVYLSLYIYYISQFEIVAFSEKAISNLPAP